MDGAFIKICSVAFGGAIGSIARYLINISPLQTAPYPFQDSLGKFPLPTFVVNIIGSFFIGFFLVLFGDKMNVSENIRLAVMVGFLGAFTTFSTFELEIWELLNKNRYAIALGYLVLSVLVGFAGLLCGIWLARKF